MTGTFVKSKSEYVKLGNKSMEDNEEKQTRGDREERNERTTKTFELSPLFRLPHCFVSPFAFSKCLSFCQFSFFFFV